MKKLSVITLCIFGVFIYMIDNDKTTTIGKSNLLPSTISSSTVFISVDGNGTTCIKDEPCSFERLNLYSKNKLVPKAGSLVVFREGMYNFSLNGVKRVYLPGGTKGKPTIYESYKNEKVVFNGSRISRKDTLKEEWREGRLELRDNYTILRRVEVKNMSQYGIRILGSHNIIEGCKIHNNALSGIEIFNYKDKYSIKATGGSFNIIRDNIIFDNSDVNLKHHNYNDGGNADGITIHSGVENLISHNTIYNNSDDGIDVWQSMNTKVEYNLVYENGQGDLGDGYGIKLGGADKESPLGANAIAQYNISVKNKKSGFNVNRGKNVFIAYNTAYKNGEYGYTLADDTKVFNNISFENKSGDFGWSNGLKQENNSWQLNDTFTFKTLDRDSKDFLRLVADDKFKSLGAYGVEKKGN